MWNNLVEIFTAQLFPSEEQKLKQRDGLSDEDVEELRMISGFDVSEIFRLRKVFYKHTHDKDFISKNDFLEISGIAVNPLKERICICFGFTSKKTALDFKDFLYGVSLFNSPGSRETKLKVAFQIQDFDGDNVISKEDLRQYLTILLEKAPEEVSEPVLGRIEDKEISQIIKKVFEEVASDQNSGIITYSDFQRVVAPTDFQAKLRIAF